MGRKSLVEKIKEEITVSNNRRHTWVVAYDFETTPSPHFYTLLKKHMGNQVNSGATFQRVQSSLIETNDLHGALVAIKLIEYYKGQGRLYKATHIPQEMIPNYTITLTVDPEERRSLCRAVGWAITYKARGNQIGEETDLLYETIIGLLYSVEAETAPITETSTLRGLLADLTRYLEGQLPRGGICTLEGRYAETALNAATWFLQESQYSKADRYQASLFNLLWRLNNDTPPPEATQRNIDGLLSEQPVQVWLQR